MTSWSKRDWLTLATLTSLALTAYLCSESVRYGDSSTYAIQLVQGKLIEPGHLLWRPFGFAFAYGLGLTGNSSDALWAMQYLSLGASVLAVIAVYRVARNYFTVDIAAITTALFLVSNGYWDYAYSGCSYSLSVLFGALAWYFVSRQPEPPLANNLGFWNALNAGLFSGLSTATWGIQFISVPAVWLGLMFVGGHAANFNTRVVKTILFGVGLAIPLLTPLVCRWGSKPA